MHVSVSVYVQYECILNDVFLWELVILIMCDSVFVLTLPVVSVCQTVCVYVIKGVYLLVMPSWTAWLPARLWMSQSCMLTTDTHTSTLWRVRVFVFVCLCAYVSQCDTPSTVWVYIYFCMHAYGSVWGSISFICIFVCVYVGCEVGGGSCVSQ